jgi:hypothetical protein
MSFSPPAFDRACVDHQRNWAAMDAELYGICRRYPGHTDIGRVNAKLWLIGRSFATGIERQIDSDGTQGGSMTQLARHLRKNSRQVDTVLRRARKISEPLDER